MEKKRTVMPGGRFTDDELELLKNVFAESFPVLRLLRKIMLQMPLGETEKNEWKRIFKGNEPLLDVMYKVFLPELDADVPVLQQVDLHMTLNVTDKDEHMVKMMAESRQMVIDYLKQQLLVLEVGGTLSCSDLHLSSMINFTSSPEKFYVNYIARNTIIGHIEQQLNQINLLAGQKSETPEETIKRLNQNSNK